MDKRALNYLLWIPFTHVNFAQCARTLLTAQWNLQVQAEESIFFPTTARFASLFQTDLLSVKKIFLHLNPNSMDLIATVIIAIIIINGLKNHRYKT